MNRMTPIDFTRSAVPNNPKLAGHKATKTMKADFGRYDLYAIHTRWGVHWMVSDNEEMDELDLPNIIRQSDDPEMIITFLKLNGYEPDEELELE